MHSLNMYINPQSFLSKLLTKEWQCKVRRRVCGSQRRLSHTLHGSEDPPGWKSTSFYLFLFDTKVSIWLLGLVCIVDKVRRQEIIDKKGKSSCFGLSMIVTVWCSTYRQTVLDRLLYYHHHTSLYMQTMCHFVWMDFINVHL